MRDMKEVEPRPNSIRDISVSRKKISEYSEDSLPEDSSADFQIRTIPDGFNSGRTYYLQTNSVEFCETIVCDLLKTVKIAKRRAAKASSFRRGQKRMRAVFESSVFQSCSWALIILNFAVSVAGAQIQGSSPSIQATLSKLDLFLVSAFTFELFVNAFANWFDRFRSNLWNWFDVVLVVLSLIGLTPAGLSLRIVLLLRSCRVLRIFGKVKAVAKIFEALSYAIFPMAHAFFIIFVIAAIYSVVGAIFYADTAPDEFGSFVRAFVAMFRITVGNVEWWFDVFPAIRPDGSISFWTTLYFVSYVVLLVHERLRARHRMPMPMTYVRWAVGAGVQIVINWIFVQVSIAVLLDNFLTASNNIKTAERLQTMQANQAQKLVRNPLDPLLLKLCKEYTDDAGLSRMIQDLFKVLDMDNSGDLGSQEFQAALKKLNFDPPIFLSDSDFIALTCHGTLCNSRGKLSQDGFEKMMRDQMLRYTQARLSTSSEFWTITDEEFTEIAALKQILSSQLTLIREQELMRREILDLRKVRLDTSPAAVLETQYPQSAGAFDNTRSEGCPHLDFLFEKFKRGVLDICKPSKCLAPSSCTCSEQATMARVDCLRQTILKEQESMQCLEPSNVPTQPDDSAVDGIDAALQDTAAGQLETDDMSCNGATATPGNMSNSFRAGCLNKDRQSVKRLHSVRSLSSLSSLAIQFGPDTFKEGSQEDIAEYSVLKDKSIQNIEPEKNVQGHGCDSDYTTDNQGKSLHFEIPKMLQTFPEQNGVHYKQLGFQTMNVLDTPKVNSFPVMGVEMSCAQALDLSDCLQVPPVNCCDEESSPDHRWQDSLLFASALHYAEDAQDPGVIASIEELSNGDANSESINISVDVGRMFAHHSLIDQAGYVGIVDAAIA